MLNITIFVKDTNSGKMVYDIKDEHQRRYFGAMLEVNRILEENYFSLPICQDEIKQSLRRTLQHPANNDVINVIINNNPNAEETIQIRD
jgi:hypothetical protein